MSRLAIITALLLGGCSDGCTSPTDCSRWWHTAAEDNTKPLSYEYMKDCCTSSAWDTDECIADLVEHNSKLKAEETGDE